MNRNEFKRNLAAYKQAFENTMNSFGEGLDGSAFLVSEDSRDFRNKAREYRDFLRDSKTLDTIQTRVDLVFTSFGYPQNDPGRTHVDKLLRIIDDITYMMNRGQPILKDGVDFEPSDPEEDVGSTPNTPPQVQVHVQQLAVPEKVTWQWLKENVDIKWFYIIPAGFTGLLIGALMLGVTIGGWDITKDLYRSLIVEEERQFPNGQQKVQVAGVAGRRRTLSEQNKTELTKLFSKIGNMEIELTCVENDQESCSFANEIAASINSNSNLNLKAKPEGYLSIIRDVLVLSHQGETNRIGEELCRILKEYSCINNPKSTNKMDKSITVVVGSN